MSFHKTIVVGYLSADPKVKEFENGSKVTSFSIAVNEKGGGRDHTEWYNIDTYAKTADNCAKYLKKGSQVLVEGTMHTRDYNGKRYTSLKGFNVRFLGGGQRDAGPSLDDIPFD